MRFDRLELAALTIAALVTASGAAPPAQAASSSIDAGKDTPRRVLRASLYPYIPDPGGAYLALERAFEARHPKVNLEISLLGDYYYDHRPEKGGILYTKADVYEVDSVFLADFVESKKIQPLGADFEPTSATLIPFARSVATVEGQLVGMPHWVCGNFLIYRAGDDAIERARTLADIEGAIGGASSEPRWLLADFSGRSTLGEMYLDGLMDHYGSREVALAKIDPAALDPAVFGAMQRSVALVRPGFGRDGDYHDSTGFYARQFARGAGRALVGYSEQLYYALGEAMYSCRKDEGCLTHEKVRVAEWPLADAGSRPISWVDTLVIDAGATGDKRTDAERFIRFMLEPETYKLVLVPGWGTPPRYLLPARDDLYRDKDLLAAAPLYAAFRARIAEATPITAVGLNQRLREIGERLDKELPPR